MPLTVPIRLKVGAGGKAISAGDELSSRFATLDHALIHAVVRTHHWRQLLETGQARTAYDLARLEKCRVSYVQRHLPLAFLPPLLVEAIIDGRQPYWCSLSVLVSGTLTPNWPTSIRGEAAMVAT